MDEIHRTYRISTRFIDGGWSARITHASGSRVPVDVAATEAEGEATCLDRAKAALDRYVAYLGSRADRLEE